jgi:hypothetical protein
LLEEEACSGCNCRDVLRRGFAEVERDGGLAWLDAEGKDKSPGRRLLLREDIVGDARVLESVWWGGKPGAWP